MVRHLLLNNGRRCFACWEVDYCHCVTAASSEREFGSVLSRDCASSYVSATSSSVPMRSVASG